MANKKEEFEHLNELYQALMLLKTTKEFASFFADLCTPNELRAMGDRWLAARLIKEGVAYRTIYENTGISTATVTRVARAISYGAGGYNIILDRSMRGKK